MAKKETRRKKELDNEVVCRMAFGSLHHGILFDQESHEVTLKRFARHFGEVESPEETLKTLNSLLQEVVYGTLEGSFAHIAKELGISPNRY